MGFDMSFTTNGTMDGELVLTQNFINPKADKSILLFFTNGYVPPIPYPRRCYELGRAIRKIIDGSERKVLVQASGGMSHFPGTPLYGEVDDLNQLLLHAGPPPDERKRIHRRRLVSHARRVAEDPDAARVDQEALLRRERRDRAAHELRDVGRVRLRRVHEDVVACEHVAEGRERGHVAGDDDGAGVAEAVRIGFGSYERADVVAPLAQFRRERAADIAGGAGQEDSHGIPACGADFSPRRRDESRPTFLLSLSG